MAVMLLLCLLLASRALAIGAAAIGALMAHARAAGAAMVGAVAASRRRPDLRAIVGGLCALGVPGGFSRTTPGFRPPMIADGLVAPFRRLGAAFGPIDRLSLHRSKLTLGSQVPVRRRRGAIRSR